MKPLTAIIGPKRATVAHGRVSTEELARGDSANMHYVYLIKSAAATGERRYIGYTEDLRQRVAEHNAGKNVSTAPYRPWLLHAYLGLSTKPQALACEKYLKSGSGHAFANKRLW